jgi:hypothetical protein
LGTSSASSSICANPRDRLLDVEIAQTRLDVGDYAERRQIAVAERHPWTTSADGVSELTLQQVERQRVLEE